MVTAAQSNFLKIALPRGVEIQIPKGWWVLTAAHNQLIDTSVEAVLDLAGIEVGDDEVVNLIAANSMPRSTYAAIRVDSITPVSASELEIANLTTVELQHLRDITHCAMLAILPQQGNNLLG